MLRAYQSLTQFIFFLAALVNRAGRVAADDVFNARGHHDLRASDARRADAVDDELDVLHLFADDLERVDQSREHDDGRSVLVVVKDGNVEFFFQTLFDFKATRRGNVFEIDAAKGDARYF